MPTYRGLSWYRKHFTLDSSFQDRKIFLEFQGIRDAGTFYVNGTKIGIQEDEISPAGLDITAAVQFGADNVIAVQVNNDDLEPDQTYVPGQVFDWSTVSFYPMYGGLYTDANLIVTDKLHQTLPLYRNLATSGVYVYATGIDTLAKSATVTFEGEVQNEYTTDQMATFSADRHRPRRQRRLVSGRRAAEHPCRADRHPHGERAHCERAPVGAGLPVRVHGPVLREGRQ